MLPAILSSGYDRAQVLAESHPDVPQAFLRKPYVSGDLREAIRLALGGVAAAG